MSDDVLRWRDDAPPMAVCLRRGFSTLPARWFDFTGACPLCGKSLVYPAATCDRGAAQYDYATCGGAERHRWQVYYRKADLGRAPTRMRLLKALPDDVERARGQLAAYLSESQAREAL